MNGDENVRTPRASAIFDETKTSGESMGSGNTSEKPKRRKVSRRRFVGEVAVGAAGAAAIATQAGCSGDASGQTSGPRDFFRPNRFEWKRREVHPTSNRGWSDTDFTAPAAGVPPSITIFDRALSAADFAETLVAHGIETDVVYAFWDGSFVRQRELAVPLIALADAVGASPPSADQPFVVARSPTRATVFAGATERVADALNDPSYRYRLTYPREAALNSGVVLFDFEGELFYYARAVEGYGCRTFVKYFESIGGADAYEGPEDTALDDYIVDNIPVDDFLDLDSGERVDVLPSWG